MTLSKSAPLLILTLTAQSLMAGWSDVKALPPRTDIRLERAGNKAATAELQSATDEALTLTLDDGSTVSIALEDIRRVSVRNRAHRKRNTYIGMGVGMFFGVGAAALASLPGFLVMTGLGAWFGYIFPTGLGWHELYRQ